MTVIVKKIMAKLLNRETVTYIIFGVLTTVISIAIYTLCIGKGMDVLPANTLSTVIAIAFAFVTNKIWVFESKDTSLKTIAGEFAVFSAGRFVTYIIETGLLVLLVDILLLHSVYCKYFTQIVIIILNYLISKFAVFRK